MESKKNIITICMGSSCFSRGNRRMVQTIQEYLKMNQLDETVLLQGAHCMNSCEKGPVMKINDQIIFQVAAERLEEVLDTYFQIKPSEG